MKINAHGAILNVGSAIISPTFVVLAQVETFDGPAITRPGEEVPTHDDVGVVEVIADALHRLEELSGTLLYDPVDATHDSSTGIIGLAESGDERPFQLVLPDTASSQWDFQGYVSRFALQGMDANSGKLRADFAIRPTRVVTFP